MNKYYLVKPDRHIKLSRVVYILCGVTCLLALIVISNSLLDPSYFKSARRAANQVITKQVLKNNATKIIENNNHHHGVIKEYFKKRQNASLSKLGEILFLNAPLPERRSKTFEILIWKDGPFLERRHIRHFSNKKNDPFDKCSVNNCVLTYESSNLTTADAVIFLLHRLQGASSLPDPLKPRLPDQKWIFLTDESPYNTFLYKSQNNWENYSGIFNWSMSYKMESDIPVPYGRTVSLSNEITLSEPDINEKISKLIPYGNEKRKDVLAAILTSNCVTKNPRMEYVHELQKYMDVDIYGGCGDKLKTACPGHFGADCPKLNDYMFYLAFENSNCNQYITEKLFWNAYSKGSVPVIMGPLPKTCEMLLPPNSYLHTHSYARPADLARHMMFLNDTYGDNYLNLHKWRANFATSNEHGYFGTKSYHYCRVCEALNYNDESDTIYEDLSFYLNPDENCK